MGPVPREVTAVAGCTCGGLQWHREDCTLFSLPYADAQAAVDAAEARLAAYTAHLNAGLRAFTRHGGSVSA